MTDLYNEIIEKFIERSFGCRLTDATALYNSPPKINIECVYVLRVRKKQFLTETIFGVQ